MKKINRNPKAINVRAYVAVILTAILCWSFAFWAINILNDYAWSLFIWLPFVLGATSTILYGYNNPVDKQRLFSISAFTMLVFCVGLVSFAWEGIICLIMAFPIGMLFTWIGHWAGYKFLKSKIGSPTSTVILLFFSVPSLMAFESVNEDEDIIRSVVSYIEIDATPDHVWEKVIAFPHLKDPEEIIFKTGIAYPISATIYGEGVGAKRYCNFSTGQFVEPITIWNKPFLLRFSVDEQPEPMKELSFYDIHPNHLHGYWVSKQGQFKLTLLSNGHTLLEGTTWYINKIKPGFYWSLWSDYIVHKIHRRVLEHIKVQAEL